MLVINDETPVSTDPFGGLGIPIDDLSREEFLKVRETLTRVGIVDGKEIQQTCYVLHKRGKYAIMHHVEMRMLDGEDVEMTEEERGHRNTVAFMLDQWGLVLVDDLEAIKNPRAEPGSVAVIPYRSKSSYSLRPLYEIGWVKTPVPS